MPNHPTEVVAAEVEVHHAELVVEVAAGQVAADWVVAVAAELTLLAHRLLMKVDATAAVAEVVVKQHQHLEGPVYHHDCLLLQMVVANWVVVEEANWVVAEV